MSTTLTPPSSEKSGLAALPGMSEHVRHHRPSKLLAILVLSVVAGLLMAVLALPLIGSIGVGAKASADFFDNLPTQLVVPPLPQRSVILDASGATIATLHGPEDRVSIPFSDIPTPMRNAIVAIEDRRFYEHHGVDYKGLIRAAVTNQENGSVTQGGSTLTQQYVKNVLLESATTPAEQKAATDRSVQRKLREARYALALERKLTKDQILTNYLNIAPFGDGAYGVEAAAEHYFGIHAKQLNVVQSATLAGIVNAPSAYDPKLHPKAALARRNVVIDQMVVAKDMDKKTATFAKSFPLGLSTAYKPTTDGCETAGSEAFFCDYVRSTLLSDPKFGATYEIRQRRLFEGGLTIKTSIDPKVQADAQSAVDTIIPPGGRVATAAVVMQPGTGNVLAMAVNRVYGDTSDHLPAYGVVKGKVVESKDRVHTKFNYATTYPGYQPGSTFKMFTLAAALEKGLSTNTSFFSPGCVYLTNFGPNPTGGYQQCLPDVPTALGGVQPPFGVGYANSDPAEAGIYNMAAATAYSVNTYFVQLEKKVGLGPVRDMAQRLGVRSPTLNGPADDLGGSLTLGSHEVTPLDMATAYATIAAHGLRCYPKSVLSMTVGGKAVSYTGTPKCQQVLKPGIADTVTSLLEGVISSAGGTGANNGQIGRPAAGKTGTTNSNYDAWFDGYIPQLATAVWVGDGRSPTKYPLRVTATTPDGVVTNGTPNWPQYAEVFGGDLPTKIWASIMIAASANLPVLEFPPADPQTVIGVTALVPNVAGFDLASATTVISAAGFTPVSGGGVSSGNPVGTVAYTSPGGGFQQSQGSTVTIFTSTGLPPPPPVVTKAPTTKPTAKATTKVKTPVVKAPVVKPKARVPKR